MTGGKLPCSYEAVAGPVAAGTVRVTLVTKELCPNGIVIGKTETVAAGWGTVTTPGWVADGDHPENGCGVPSVIVKTPVKPGVAPAGGAVNVTSEKDGDELQGVSTEPADG